MIYTAQTKKAIDIIFEKHKNQVDKAGMPYVLHPLHVAEKMNDEETTIVALLHDIVEDTDMTFKDLAQAGFSNNVIEALKYLTHADNLEYFDYIKNIGNNEIATKVKIADLEHNSDLTRLNEINKYDLIRVEKYQKCLEYLKGIQSMREGKNKENYIIEKKMTSDELNNKMMAGILGFVVGDALGVPFEFLKRKSLESYPIHDMVGYGTHNVPEGTWSDDTSLMLASMDSIREQGQINYEDIMCKFSEWVDNAKYTATGVFFDIGNATSKAISNFKHGTNAVNCGVKGFNENGNGSLMRILPFVYYINCNNFTEIESTNIINNASSITHAHEISKLGCKIYSDYVTFILNGFDKFEALKRIKNVDYSRFYSKESINVYKRILSDNLYSRDESDIRSSGYVVDSLEASIWCTLHSNSYEEAVIKAVKLGEDTDPIAAITGSLNGIIYGIDSIPERWINKLKGKEYLDNLSSQFINSLNNEKKNSRR